MLPGSRCWTLLNSRLWVRIPVAELKSVVAIWNVSKLPVNIMSGWYRWQSEWQFISDMGGMPAIWGCEIKDWISNSMVKLTVKLMVKLNKQPFSVARKYHVSRHHPYPPLFISSAPNHPGSMFPIPTVSHDISNYSWNNANKTPLWLKCLPCLTRNNDAGNKKIKKE